MKNNFCIFILLVLQCATVYSQNSETIWSSLTWVWNPCPPPINDPIGGPVDLIPPDDPYACDAWIYIQVLLYLTVNHPSDGLLPTYAQELVGIPIGSPNRYTIDYANHIELRNMSNSKFPNGSQMTGRGIR